jgi:hypothetical protein
MTLVRTRSALLAFVASLALSATAGLAANAAGPGATGTGATGPGAMTSGPTSVNTPGPGHQNYLTGVATLTRRDAWAVGYYCQASCRTLAYHDLVMHWNGRRWSVASAPNPGSQDRLDDVSASSASNVWAVGTYIGPADSLAPLLLHWNGRRWTESAMFYLGLTTMSAVSVVTANDAWAVGDIGNSTNRDQSTFMLRWNGKHWNQVSSPNPGPVDDLDDVAALSARNAWAVGQYCTARCGSLAPELRGLVLHWNGTKWSKSALPVKDTQMISAIAVLSPTSAWATGLEGFPNTRPLILHWNGQKWSSVTSPYVVPAALAFGSADDGWGIGTGSSMRWNGRKWQLANVPAPDTSVFSGASAGQPADVWAVGSYCTSACDSSAPRIDTLAMQWNGRTWTRR